MGLNFGKPDNIAAFIKDEDGNWRKLGDVTSMSIEHDAMCNETTLSVDVFGPLYGPDFWEFKPKSEETTYTFTSDCAWTADDVKALLGFDTPSKRDRYREHLPEKVIVSGPCVISFWKDGTKTISRCHDGDEMDVRTGIILNAIKKWMPGGTYWQGVMDDVTVEYQGKKEKVEPNFKLPDNLEVIGHCEIVHAPVNHDKPCRPYMRGGRYGDDEKMHVIELIESGMTQREVSSATGISQATISVWMKQWRGND